MKFRQIIVASMISMATLSSRAALVANMEGGLGCAEIAAQQVAGSEVSTIVASFAAAS